MSQQAYIFIGPPGSGKGTLSRLCIDSFGWVQLSTGNLCRKHIAEQTDLGKQIDFIIKSGKLINDQLITDMVDCWLNEVVETHTTLILDGFPRTIEQVKLFLQMVHDKYPQLELRFVRLLIADEMAIDRLISRYVCSNRACQAVFSANADSGLGSKESMVCDYCGSVLCKRPDDAETQVMQTRLQVYRKHEQAMLDYLQEMHMPIEAFEADMPVEDMFNGFVKAMIR